MRPAASQPPAHSLPITSFSYFLVFTAFLSALSLSPVAVNVAAHQSPLGGLVKSPLPFTAGDKGKEGISLPRSILKPRQALWTGRVGLMSLWGGVKLFLL